MRYILLLLFFVLSGAVLKGQNKSESTEGTISYVSFQNVYVRFSSTEHIQKGDTLYISGKGNMVPALIVKELSSISCVCAPMTSQALSISGKVYHITRHMVPEKTAEMIIPPVPPVTELKPDTVFKKPDTSYKKPAVTSVSRQRIHGYLSVASYTDFSSLSSTNSQRMRYSFSMNARNLGNSNFSAECYIAFVHTDHQWTEIKKDLFNGLKIYTLAVNYDFGRKASLWFGRKLNPKISSLGSMDGLQFELKIRSFSAGIVAGFRPDYLDYGFNARLFQAGAYISQEKTSRNGYMQTTLAFIEQQNSGKTDRRFIYLQHNNSLVKNLSFFGSLEVDLYKQNLNYTDSSLSASMKPWMSNLYLSLNYRPVRQLYLSVSYSSRKNVIYYETYRLLYPDSYKTLLINLANNQTLQGISFQVNYRPWNKLILGVTTGYRFQEGDPRPSKNVYAFATYSQIPGINMSATASINYLEAGYVTGKIYTVGLNRDIAKGKVYAGISYHYLDYVYYGQEFRLAQNSGEVDLTWRIIRKLALSLYYEGTFDKTENYNRIFAQVNMNF